MLRYNVTKYNIGMFLLKRFEARFLICFVDARSIVELLSRFLNCDNFLLACANQCQVSQGALVKRGRAHIKCDIVGAYFFRESEVVLVGVGVE